MLQSAITEVLTSWVALVHRTADGEVLPGMKPCDLNKSLLDRGFKEARNFTADDYRRLGFRVVPAHLEGRPNSKLLPIVVLV